MTKHDPEEDEAPTSDAPSSDAAAGADESDEDEAPPISADTSNGAAASAPARRSNVAPPASAVVAYGAAIAVTALVAGTFQVAFSPTFAGTNRSFLILGGLYAVTSILAVLRLKKRGELFRIRPRSGDITFAGLVAFVLYGLAFVFHSLVTSPAAAHHGWIIRVYLVTGDPFAENRHLVAAGVALLGALEEMTWRGLVTPLLEERAGVLPGNVAATVLFAAAHVPTVFLLADPIAGLNPLLPLAAFGCGAAWAYLRWRMDRLVPSLLSHALFTWAVIEFPLFALGR
jgi:membrane protease YdiL (CAAX protease family)